MRFGTGQETVDGCPKAVSSFRMPKVPLSPLVHLFHGWVSHRTERKSTNLCGATPPDVAILRLVTNRVGRRSPLLFAAVVESGRIRPSSFPTESRPGC